MKKNFFMMIIFILALVFSGCAAGQRQAIELKLPEPGLPNAYQTQPKAPADTEAEALTEMEETTGLLTLQQALSLSLMKNPELAAFTWAVRAKEAERLQASLAPNPELGIGSENIAGSGEMSGTGAAETTVQLSQLIELGGKRLKRERVAALEKNLAEWDFKSKRLAVFTSVKTAYIEVLSTQSYLELAGEMVDLTEQVYLTVSERVKAGKVSPIEETKAKVSLLSSQIKTERIKRDLKTARKKLAAHWVNDTPLFKMVEGELDRLSPVPSQGVLAGYISKNPDLARWTAEMESRRAALNLSKAGKVPDLTVSGGYRRLNETDDNAFIAALSVPLMFFNQNQGEIAAAGHRLSQGIQEQKAVEIRIKTALNAAYQSLSIADAEANVLKNKVLPFAQIAFDAVNQGYRLGKFNFLEVLDAQRTLFETKEQYLKSITAYHTSVAEVEGLIGVGLDKVVYTAKSDI